MALIGGEKMTNKVLFCANVDHHFTGFHIPYLKWFKDKGWEVHVAANGSIDIPYVDFKYNIPIQRAPIRLKNIKAYKEFKTILNQNKYQIIHCHTPMGGMLARLAAIKARKEGTQLIYTAHGFHFCKGSPLYNWIMYYPIEKMMAHFTDCLITINREDYKLASSQFKVKQIEHVHGVGINTEEFKPVSTNKKNELKKSFGYDPDKILLFYAAEFNRNKNQQFLLHSLALIKEELPNAKLLLAGDGPLLEKCKQLAKNLGISNMVDFLGLRNDIKEILPMCDLAVASSLREGLPVNIMEAMACELPIVAVDNRGHRELIRNNQNGWILEESNMFDFSRKIISLAKNKALQDEFGINGRKIILDKYSIDKVLLEKSRIYKTFMEETEGLMWVPH